MSGLPEESPSLDTHWSRILYHDLFSERAGGVSRDPDALTGDEPGPPTSDSGLRRGRGQFEAMPMATGVGRVDADPGHSRSTIAAAVILLGVVIAAYLAVAGLVRVLSIPDTTSVVVRQINVTEGKWSANPKRAALVLRS